jgi:hypothetical protein
MITLNRRGSVSRKPTKDEARQLLSFPFGLTRTVGVPENFRRAACRRVARSPSLDVRPRDQTPGLLA